MAGEVTEVRRDLGVFVDTGIPNKEIVVSLDVLPEMKELWPKKGINFTFVWMWTKRPYLGTSSRV